MSLFRFLGSLLCCCTISYFTAFAQNSVLASGEWYKIGVTQAGIHKIDVAFLQKAGINPAGINPKNIRLYGNGGGMLPQANQSFRYNDLVENAIYVSGESDDMFDNADYILFYAQSPHAILYDTLQKQFSHKTNLYSDTTFYFLTISATPGLRISDQAEIGGATHMITSFDDYIFHEKDLTNQLAQTDLPGDDFAGSGREWYGEKFAYTVTQNFDFTLPGIIPDSKIKVTSAVMARTPGATLFSLRLNEQYLGEQTFTGVSMDRYAAKGENNINTFVINAAQLSTINNLKINLTYDKKGLSQAGAYLNFLGLHIKRELKLYGKQTAVRSLESIGFQAANFTVSEANSQLTIWDVTYPLYPKNQLYTLNDTQAVFGVQTNTLREFILFTGSAFDAPVSVQRISNQDLHALSTPQLLIITPDQFLEQARQLAVFRQQHDGLRVEIATINQVYNEFSSGKQDITAIRDFIRFLYLKDQSLQYVLLMGDASYDYKNRVTPNTNFVPIYESRESLHPIFSYSSDDYFGFMDEQEGEWTENTQGDQQIDVAIGRLPVKSSQEAANVVAKLMRYSTEAKTLGKWRNQICFVADDGDNNTHQQDADRLTEQLATKYPRLNITKIYMDAFPQQANANGQTAPEVHKAIERAVEKGHLILNYTGHGGEKGWSVEQILTREQINEWKNAVLPLMVTATCQFGRYDDPIEISGAESALLNPIGGAIGLITTTRPVFSNTNYALNTAFYAAVFEPKNGQMPRLGDAMKLTKNNSLSGSINRNFSLLGDPSMRLAYPEEEVVIDKINNKDISAGADTLKALRKITLEGKIQNPFTKSLQAGFNGILSATVFDKKTTKTTFGTESSARMNFTVQQNIIFEGKATVKNGLFQMSFVVPKDIDYQFDTGKISLYAQDGDKLWDAAGSQAVMVGGSIPQTDTDQTPPQIRLFMNDTTFVNGSITGSNTVLLAHLFDENGINITQTGIGHEMVATLSTASGNPILMNEYYTASTDDYRKGQILYPFKNLSTGNYTLTLKAWDTHNNSSQASIDFLVATSEALALRNVFNFPNPFSDFTHFGFDHNRAGEDLEITVDIYSLSGKHIKTLQTIVMASPEQFRDLLWDGNSSNENKLYSGTYIYKLNVRSMADGSQTHLTEKMVIIR